LSSATPDHQHPRNNFQTLSSSHLISWPLDPILYKTTSRIILALLHNLSTRPVTTPQNWGSAQRCSMNLVYPKFTTITILEISNNPQKRKIYLNCNSRPQHSQRPSKIGFINHQISPKRKGIKVWVIYTIKWVSWHFNFILNFRCRKSL